MKKITIICIALLSLTIISCKEKATSKVKSTNLETAKERDEKINVGTAMIEFDKTEFNFGKVTEGEIVKGTFVVSNKGETDLLILDAKASCGCTVPEWPKKPIKPGESADIKFEFNTKGKKGNQTKTITLQTNTEKITERLIIKGTVLPMVKIN
jgi:uncharacterized protein DUF1573